MAAVARSVMGVKDRGGGELDHHLGGVDGGELVREVGLSGLVGLLEEDRSRKGWVVCGKNSRLWEFIEYLLK